MKTLFFTSSLGGGGAEMHLLRLLQHLPRERVQPTLAVARRGGSYEARLPADVPVHSWFAQERSSTLSCLACAPLLAHLCTTLRPDVVAGVMEMPNLTVLAGLRALPRRPCLVLLVQVAPGPAYGGSLLGAGILAGIRHTYHLADRVIALSAGVRDDLVALDPRLAAKTAVIPNAIVDEHLEKGRAHPVARPPGPPIIVGCGRLAAQKNFPLLLAAFAALRRQRPARLWLLGDGPDRAALQARAAQLGISADVTFHGFVDNPFAYLAAADLFVLSADFEGFGNVLVEAMACGLPVVSTRCPHGPAEIITPDENGLLVPPRDERALTAAMLRVLADDALRRRLIAGGVRRARDFGAAGIAARYADELALTCGRRAASG